VNFAIQIKKLQYEEYSERFIFLFLFLSNSLVAGSGEFGVQTRAPPKYFPYSSQLSCTQMTHFIFFYNHIIVILSLNQIGLNT
jgi:hypothetical protein